MNTAGKNEDRPPTTSHLSGRGPGVNQDWPSAWWLPERERGIRADVSVGVWGGSKPGKNQEPIRQVIERTGNSHAFLNSSLRSNHSKGLILFKGKRRISFSTVLNKGR